MDTALKLTKDRSKKSLLHYDRIISTYAVSEQSSHQSATHVLLFCNLHEGHKDMAGMAGLLDVSRNAQGATFVDAIEVETRLLSADPDPKHFPSVIIKQGFVRNALCDGVHSAWTHRAMVLIIEY
jgi:hypothetical protein